MVSIKTNKLSFFFILTLIILGFLTRFLFIWQPSEVVFDEIHYGKYANGYLDGKYFFSGHPPLGTELIALGGWLGGYSPHFAFASIGEKFTDNSFIFLRLLPAVAGALIPLAVYLFLGALGLSSGLAFFAAILMVFENALLLQSRLILIDSFMILFGFLSLFCFFASRSKNHSRLYLILTGIFLGLSMAVKWTGLSFILFVLIIAFLDLMKLLLKKKFNDFRLATAKFLICFLIVPFLVYFLTFCVHFKLSSVPGPGDAFMSREFLSGEKNIFEKFLELNAVNYRSNILLKAAHPYSSKFFDWPFMKKPIFYWTGEKANIYLIGNPIIWWLSTIAVFSAILFFLTIKRLKDRNLSILLLGYFLNLLPFILIERTTFLYHYLPSLIFAISIMTYLIGRNKHYKAVIIILLILSIGSFFYFSPVTYGLDLNSRQYQNRAWLINLWEK